MKTKSLLSGAFLFVCCLLLSTCKNNDSLELGKTNGFAMQTAPTANDNKLNINENKSNTNENKSFSTEEEQNFDLPKIQVAESEYEKYRQKIFFALLEQKIISPERTLINFSHVCSLKVGKKTFLVISIFELLKNASFDRGYNRAILLDSSFKVANTLTIFADSSFFCDGNKLYLHNSKIGFDADQSSGNSYSNGDNTIIFDEKGRVDGSQTTDFRTLPAMKERLKKGITPQ